MPYSLRPTSDFLKDIAKLDKSIKIIVEKRLERIKQNPRLSKPLEHEANCYTERIKNYRIVFEVNGEEIILYRIRRRKQAYLS
jgi:mRNA-degrading endonuclease RelE of RelBE toxin-antitoxin system